MFDACTLVMHVYVRVKAGFNKTVTRSRSRLIQTDRGLLRKDYSKFWTVLELKMFSFTA